MAVKLFSTSDDRGQRQQIAMSRRPNVLWHRRRLLSPRQRNEMARFARSPKRRLWVALAFALVASAFGVAVVGLTDWSQPFASVLMLGLAAYFVANALTAIWYGVIAKRSFRQHRLLMQSLRAKRVACSGCGYWLEGCATESDGCTVCPECGAAWRLPAFGGS